MFAVVFTRTVPNAASTEVYRQLIRDDGVRVLSPTVGRLERYAQAYGGGTGSVAPRPPRFSGWQAAVLGRQNWCGREIPSSKRSRPAGDGPEVLLMRYVAIRSVRVGDERVLNS